MSLKLFEERDTRDKNTLLSKNTSTNFVFKLAIYLLTVSKSICKHHILYDFLDPHFIGGIPPVTLNPHYKSLQAVTACTPISTLIVTPVKMLFSQENFKFVLL